jgi:hypothetical protein
MPAGRPPKITEALKTQIAELFFLAFSDQQVADFVGVHERTIRRFRAGTLCPAIKKAEIAREMPYRKRIWDGVGNWCGAAWMLERKYPHQFAKPEIQLNWGNTYNQNNLTISISSQDAKSIEAQARPIRDEVAGMFEKYRPQLGNGNREESRQSETG